jgi:MarR family transcriptional regulator, organic hydroperoxide resistance regulator
MRHPRAVQAVLDLYPRIYFACHARHVRDAASGGELSAHQASILSHLDEVEPTSMSELSEHMGVTLSTMSLGIKRLVAGGYVVSERSDTDRRVVELRLTGAGVRMKEAQTVLDAERVDAVLGRLSRGERNQAIEGLRLLAQASAEQMRAWSNAGQRTRRPVSRSGR